MKVALNIAECGEFELSNEAIDLYNSIVNERYPNKGVQRINGQLVLLTTLYKYNVINMLRHDPILIEVLETLGSKANTEDSVIIIKEIPDALRDYYEITGKKYNTEEIKINIEQFTYDTICNLRLHELSDSDLRQEIAKLKEIIDQFAEEY